MRQTTTLLARAGKFEVPLACSMTETVQTLLSRLPNSSEDIVGLHFHRSGKLHNMVLMKFNWPNAP